MSHSGEHIDPFLIEFVVNLRWTLNYVTQRLDPTVESHYPQLVADAAEMEAVLSSSCASLRSLGGLPLGALEMARSGMSYLLLAEGLLGHCPPTMHAYLLRATAAASVKSSTQRQLRRRARRVNVSDLASGLPTDDDDTEGHSNGSEEGICASVETRSVSSITDSSVFAPVQEGDTECQTMQLLLRWLSSEGVLSLEELAETLQVPLTDVSSSSFMHGRGGEINMEARVGSSRSARSAASASFLDRNSMSGSARSRGPQLRLMALRLAQLAPFYLGGHVVITRALLLHYSTTLLTFDAIRTHVHTVAPQMALEDGRSRRDSTAPIENGLFLWLRAVVHATTHEKGSYSSRKRRQKVNGEEALTAAQENCLRAIIQKYSEHPGGVGGASLSSDLSTALQDGVFLCLAVHFYQPHLMPLSSIYFSPIYYGVGSIAGASSTLRKSSTSGAAAAGATGTHRNWSALLRSVEVMGLCPGLTADEILVHGRGALPLHLLRLVEELFAVLATRAEEELRVSTDSRTERQRQRREEEVERMVASLEDVLMWDRGMKGVSVRSHSVESADLDAPRSHYQRQADSLGSLPPQQSHMDEGYREALRPMSSKRRAAQKSEGLQKKKQKVREERSSGWVPLSGSVDVLTREEQQQRRSVSVNTNPHLSVAAAMATSAVQLTTPSVRDSTQNTSKGVPRGRTNENVQSERKSPSLPPPSPPTRSYTSEQVQHTEQHLQRSLAQPCVENDFVCTPKQEKRKEFLDQSRLSSQGSREDRKTSDRSSNSSPRSQRRQKHSFGGQKQHGDKVNKDVGSPPIVLPDANPSSEGGNVLKTPRPQMLPPRDGRSVPPTIGVGSLSSAEKQPFGSPEMDANMSVRTITHSTMVADDDQPQEGAQTGQDYPILQQYSSSPVPIVQLQATPRHGQQEQQQRQLTSPGWQRLAQSTTGTSTPTLQQTPDRPVAISLSDTASGQEGSRRQEDTTTAHITRSYALNPSQSANRSSELHPVENASSGSTFSMKHFTSPSAGPQQEVCAETEGTAEHRVSRSDSSALFPSADVNVDTRVEDTPTVRSPVSPGTGVFEGDARNSARPSASNSPVAAAAAAAAVVGPLTYCSSSSDASAASSAVVHIPISRSASGAPPLVVRAPPQFPSSSDSSTSSSLSSAPPTPQHVTHRSSKLSAELSPLTQSIGNSYENALQRVKDIVDANHKSGYRSSKEGSSDYKKGNNAAGTPPSLDEQDEVTSAMASTIHRDPAASGGGGWGEEEGSWMLSASRPRSCSEADGRSMASSALSIPVRSRQKKQRANVSREGEEDHDVVVGSPSASIASGLLGQLSQLDLSALRPADREVLLGAMEQQRKLIEKLTGKLSRRQDALPAVDVDIDAGGASPVPVPPQALVYDTPPGMSRPSAGASHGGRSQRRKETSQFSKVSEVHFTEREDGQRGPPHKYSAASIDRLCAAFDQTSASLTSLQTRGSMSPSPAFLRSSVRTNLSAQAAETDVSTDLDARMHDDDDDDGELGAYNE